MVGSSFINTQPYMEMLKMGEETEVECFGLMEEFQGI